MTIFLFNWKFTVRCLFFCTRTSIHQTEWNLFPLVNRSERRAYIRILLATNIRFLSKTCHVFNRVFHWAFTNRSNHLFSLCEPLLFFLFEIPRNHVEYVGMQSVNHLRLYRTGKINNAKSSRLENCHLSTCINSFAASGSHHQKNILRIMPDSVLYPKCRAYKSRLLKRPPPRTFHWEKNINFNVPNTFFSKSL